MADAVIRSHSRIRPADSYYCVVRSPVWLGPARVLTGLFASMVCLMSSGLTTVHPSPQPVSADSPVWPYGGYDWVSTQSVFSRGDPIRTGGMSVCIAHSRPRY